MKGTLLTLFAVCTVALAADKPDLSGKWRATGNDDNAGHISIEQNGRDIQIVSAADQTEISCNTIGKECEAKLSGEPVKVSYWYNGPTLVQMVFEGKNRDHVTETKRTLAPDGKTMTVEITQLAPSAKSPERVVYIREETVTAAGAPPAQQ